MSIMESIQRFFARRSPTSAPAADRRPEDNRAVRRNSVRMRTGFVWNEKLISARPCIFKDLSVKGARVELLGDPIKPGLLAEGLKLYFDTEKHEVPCSVAWVKGRLVGLAFEGRPRPPSRSYA